MVTDLPLSVEDTHGRSYALDRNNAHSGGQGIMFSYEDKLALKLLYAPADGNNERKLAVDEKTYARYQRSLVHLMAMPHIDHLSLPIAQLKAPYCGYVMQFMTGLMPLAEMLRYFSPAEGGYPETLRKNGGLKKRLLVLKNLADILRSVHNNGIVYCDLTPSNVFVSSLPNHVETWLIDVDNLTYSNEVRTSWQTPWYRAPELYQGHPNSIEADCYSFALIAYEVLTFAKPFNGQAFRDMEEDVGWDEADVSNTADPQSMESSAQQAVESGGLDYVWEKDTKNSRPAGLPLRLVATDEIQELFVRTLGKEGRARPASRPTMNEWYRVLELACSCVTSCPNGHWHLGNKCFLCQEENDTSRYYKVSVCQVNYYAHSEDEASENGLIEKIQSKKVLREEIWFSRHLSSQKNNRIVHLPIPWRLFTGSQSRHNPDATAFNIHYGPQGITCDGCFDSALMLVSLPDRKEPSIRACWNGRFEYEFTVEEVKE